MNYLDSPQTDFLTQIKLNEFISTKLLLKLKQIHIIVLKFVDISATEYSIQCDFLERPHAD